MLRIIVLSLCALVPLVAEPNTPSPTVVRNSAAPEPILNVSAAVSVTNTGFAFSRTTGTYNGNLTVLNTTGSPISGPITVGIPNLTPGVTLTNSNGMFNGAPYIRVTESTLNAGAASTVQLRFTNPANAVISFGRITYSGVVPSAPVSPVNHPPTALGHTAHTTENIPVTINLTGSDAEGANLTFSIVAPPATGVLGVLSHVTGTSATVVYTPAPNVAGTPSFTFKVNDGTADSTPVTVIINVAALRIVNPYAAGGIGRKVSLHSHTRVTSRTVGTCVAGDTGGSDGSPSEPTCPLDRVAQFGSKGFDAVGVTDHDVRTGIAGCTWIDNSCTIGGVLLMAGAEQTVKHVTGTGAGHLVAVAVQESRGSVNQDGFPETPQQAYDGAVADGGFSYAAHPANETNSWSWPQLQTINGLRGIEVASSFSYRGENMWDRLLGSGAVVYGIAADDTHHVTSDLNKAWQVVYTPELTKNAVINALQSGNSISQRCYSTGTCLSFTAPPAVSYNTISATVNTPAYFMWVGWKDDVPVESGRTGVLDLDHNANRKISIPGRPFTSADVGRALYVPYYTSFVRTGMYHIVSVDGFSAVLDRPLGSPAVNGYTNIWWELNGGVILRGTTGTIDSYTVTKSPLVGDHKYVRLQVVLDQNREVWSQPFFIK